jgi:hypothetical protein
MMVNSGAAISPPPMPHSHPQNKMATITATGESCSDRLKTRGVMK